MIVKFLAIALFSLVSLAPLSAASSVTVEEGLQAAEMRLEEFDQKLNFRDLKTLKLTRSNERQTLMPSQRELYDQREVLLEDVIYWQGSKKLKADLLALPGKEQFVGQEAVAHEKEADEIAQAAIRAFGEIKKQFHMIRPAGLQNILVNMGVKDQGLCWQWAREITDHLRPLPFKTFDLLWAVAREGTMREHNVVVITNRGKDLQEGLLLDGWKKSGKPRWMRVADDKKHPWKLGAYYGG